MTSSEPTSAEITAEISAAMLRAQRSPFSPLAAVEAHRTTPHPTRRIVAKVTCVLVNDDDYEITVDHQYGPERYHTRSWRFNVADAEHYPVGGLIGLTVPA